VPKLAWHVEPFAERIDFLADVENHLVENLMALTHQV
jgi:hypothetical protein